MMTTSDQPYRIPTPGVPVILANGRFPGSTRTLEYLTQSELIICCDGAVDKLLARGLEPTAVVGDMDSISEAARARFSERMIEDGSQETNDLTKAIAFAVGRDLAEVLVLGGDGDRIDHTIANASLVAEHCATVRLAMMTDEGLLVPLVDSTWFACDPGQQVSIFSLQSEARFRTRGLRYELHDQSLPRLWSGSLNEAVGTEFSIDFESGVALIFLADQRR